MKTIARRNWEDETSGTEHKNDIYLVDGNIAFATDSDCVAQVVESVIKTVRGEVQLNTEFGIPYFGTVFENNRSADVWAQSVREAVTALANVSEIESFEYQYEFGKNKLSYTLKIKVSDGTTVEVSE